jgi:hypothetical protein
LMLLYLPKWKPAEESSFDTGKVPTG